MSSLIAAVVAGRWFGQPPGRADIAPGLLARGRALIADRCPAFVAGLSRTARPWGERLSDSTMPSYLPQPHATDPTHIADKDYGLVQSGDVAGA